MKSYKQIFTPSFGICAATGKNIIRQNKKAALQEFLFGSQDSIAAPETQNHLNEKIETLQNQVNSLQDRIRDLETTLENSKYALSRTLKASEATKIIQQGRFYPERQKGLLFDTK
jgi:uncharacterized protein YlxW (UPF0749 family)